MAEVVTSEQAWSKLVRGNKNFVSGVPSTSIKTLRNGVN